MTCRPDDKAARLQATVDALFGRDNSGAVEEAFDTRSQLDYAGRYSELVEDATPELAKPRSTWVDTLVGDIADRSHRPNEVLGDEITGPVLDAYEKYARLVAGENATTHTVEAKEGGIDPDRLMEIKEDAGVYDAVDDARDLLEEKFSNDPARLEYGRKWLEARIEGKGDNRSQEAQLVSAAGGNLSKNLLINNIRSGLLNHVQLATTTVPEFGIRATEAGRRAYKQAVQSKSPELDFIGGGRFYDANSPLDRFDFFSRPEHSNQGITYFTAKLKALKEGKSEEAAREIGRNAIEKTQFKSRLGNEPRAYWAEGGKTRLSLLSYAIQMKKLQNSWYKGLAEGFLNKDSEMIAKKGKALAYFYLANGAINGVTSGIPEEVSFFIKTAFPRFYANMRQADRLSLMGLLDMDTAELSRIPLTNAGFLLKVPVMYDKLSETLDKAARVLEHPESPKAWIRAMQAGSLFLPPVPIIGNKNLGNALDWAYRVTTGDYDRYTFKGKKYQSDAGNETLRLIRGRGLGESLENLQKDAQRSRF